MILLSYYKNSLLDAFFAESLVVCTLYSFGKIVAGGEGVSYSRFIEETEFLGSFLEYEFIHRDCFYGEKTVKHTLDFLVKRGTLEVNNEKIRFNKTEGAAIAFYSSLLWPTIDTYWGTLVFCSALNKKQAITVNKLQQSIQWFMESIYEEKIIQHYESCARESIYDCIMSYEKKGILETNVNKTVLLNEAYPEYIEDVLYHLEKFRKISVVKKVGLHIELRRNLISELAETPEL